jgi:hypothetical protein
MAIADLERRSAFGPDQMLAFPCGNAKAALGRLPLHMPIIHRTRAEARSRSCPPCPARLSPERPTDIGSGGSSALPVARSEVDADGALGFDCGAAIRRNRRSAPMAMNSPRRRRWSSIALEWALRTLQEIANNLGSFFG